MKLFAGDSANTIFKLCRFFRFYFLVIKVFLKLFHTMLMALQRGLCQAISKTLLSLTFLAMNAMAIKNIC